VGADVGSRPGRWAALQQTAYLPRSLALVWQAAGRLTILWLALLAVQGLLPVANVSLTRLIVNGVVAARAAHGSWESVRPLALETVAMGAIILLTEVVGAASEWVRTAQSEQVRDHLSALVHRQSVALDLASYESAEFFDRLSQVQTEASRRPLALLESLGTLVRNTITVAGMAALLAAYGWWLPLVLVASGAPAFLVALRLNQTYHDWWRRTTADRRRTEYYDTLLKHPNVAAELRLFGLGPHFAARYQQLRARLRTERLALLRDQALARLGAGLCAALLPGAAVAWMGWRALQGTASLGDLALTFQALTRAQTVIRSLLANLGELHSNLLYLESLFDFLAMRPGVADPPMPRPARAPTRHLRFRQVTFRYPGSERLALRDFDLTIPAGQTVAIVGANGAGKSTLLKLLCRLYDPDQGAVEIDGTDLRAFAVRELRQLMTVLFQFPVPFSATAAENVAFSVPDADASRAAVAAAARAAGADEVIARLPNGYDTLLGKAFADGSELSGGEWQRLALARAFLRAAPIIILDEPTSFMDSWAELAWLDRFRALAQDRTAIVITHRFTTAMRADMIYLMHEGQIVEAGTHESLLAQDGRYAQSWRAQVQAAASSTETPLGARP
jgi:ATP-binding cassette subfamily B protein